MYFTYEINDNSVAYCVNLWLWILKNKIINVSARRYLCVAPRKHNLFALSASAFRRKHSRKDCRIGNDDAIRGRRLSKGRGWREGRLEKSERKMGIIGKELCRFITRCRGRGQTFVAYAQIFCHPEPSSASVFPTSTCGCHPRGWNGPYYERGIESSASERASKHVPCSFI